MPYHLSPDKLSVLDEDSQVVPGGTHKTREEALKHLQALSINVRDASKSSWLADPTDDELYQWLVEEEEKASALKQQDYNPGNGIDRASYHPVGERFEFQEAPDWNDDTAIALPEEVWVLAHPYGDPQHQDEHEEHFDRGTNFYEKENLLPQVPVSYYHNFNPDGTPRGEPIAIGKTVGRKYLPIGRADKIHFDPNIPPEIKSRLAKAYQNGTFRSSPTVVPDFHKVNNQTGHIDNWLTGSIAVFDAQGDRQPANARAIGLPAMKALFKQAHLTFPKHLEVNMGQTTKTAPTWKARFLKAVIKALGEVDEAPGTHSHPSGSRHADHEGSTQPHEHDEKGAMKALETQGQNLVDDTSTRARFDGADISNAMKDVNPLPDFGEELERLGEGVEGQNALHEPEVNLDWKPETQRMKAIIGAQANQLKALQARADNGDFNSWVSGQLVSGKVLPAEVEELRADFLQALIDDRSTHPVMKSKDGQSITRVARLKANVERRQSHFAEMDLTGDQMKALNLQMGSLNFSQDPNKEKPFDENRRQELLKASPLGEKILEAKKS